jgi:hypothetical protein
MRFHSNSPRALDPVQSKCLRAQIREPLAAPEAPVKKISQQKNASAK